MFDQLIVQHGQRLFSLCFHLTGSRQDAEDLYQDTWLKAYKAFDRFDPGRSFEAWITQICVNTYRDRLRRNRLQRFIATFSSNEEKDRALAQLAAPEMQTSDPDLQAAIKELPEMERISLVLYYFEDMEIKKIAELTQAPEGTVKSRLHQARERLKRRLSSNDDGRSLPR